MTRQTATLQLSSLRRRTESKHAIVKAFDELIALGDWYRPLYEKLVIAEKEVVSTEVRDAIRRLVILLDGNDECVHTVCIRQPIPGGVGVDIVLEYMGNGLLDDALIDTTEPGMLIVTATMRGSREHVTTRVVGEVGWAVYAAFRATRGAGESPWAKGHWEGLPVVKPNVK